MSAGIYIHIPFCRQACHYCGYYFTTRKVDYTSFVDALLDEFATRSSCLDGRDVGSIYFGGGTPSVLPSAEIARLFQTFQSHVSLSANVEVTIEANPDDITDDCLSEWGDAGINRVSLGVQSFDDDVLASMHRLHDSRQARVAIEAIQRSQIYNFSIDLMFGLPGQTDDSWNSQITEMLAFEVPHLSCYSWEVEPRSVWGKKLKRGKLARPGAQRRVAQYRQLMQRLTAAGYQQYECASFCKPDFHSRHNSCYWLGDAYVGLGPSAHGFDGYHTRQLNVRSLKQYMTALRRGDLPGEAETLSELDRLNEIIFSTIRLSVGLDLNRLSGRFGETCCAQVEVLARPFIERGWLSSLNGTLTVTAEGRLHIDSINSQMYLLNLPTE